MYRRNVGRNNNKPAAKNFPKPIKVENLKVYVTKHAQAAITTIDIAKEVKNVDTEKPPLIVIDIVGICASWTIKETQEMICGGRFLPFKNKMTDFLKKLKATGAELMFLDSVYERQKDNLNWLQRNDKKYKDGLRLLDQIYKKPVLTELVKSGQIKKVVYMINKDITSLLRSTVEEEFGPIKRVHNIKQAVAAYALENNAYAIMADRSDYLVFSGDYKVWSLSNLDYDSLQTRQYDKKILRQSLGLSTNQIQLLALLYDYDKIPSYELSSFYKSFDVEDKQIVPKLIEYIQSNCSVCPTEDQLTKIFSQIYRCGSNEMRNLMIIYKSYHDFKPFAQHLPTESDNTLRALLEKDFVLEYQILKGDKFYLTSRFDDFRSNEFPNLFNVTTKYHQKLIGLLVKSYNHPRPRSHYPVVVKISASPSTALQLPITFPPFTIPKLNELMFADHTLTTDEIIFRMQIFNWMLELEEKVEALESMPLKHIHCCFTVAFMTRIGVLKLVEADILMKSCYDAFNAPLKIEFPTRIHPRPFRISILFNRMYKMVQRAFTMVGFEKYIHHRMFDGVLFHANYEKLFGKAVDNRMPGYAEIPASLRIYEKYADMIQD